MNETPEPLINDEYTGEPPAKRLLARLITEREKGTGMVGVHCAYAPVELIRAFDLTPVSLCAFSNASIDAAEEVLPANLCPLIKSSYGFILKDTCSFFALSDAVAAETTCDGKKEMFDLIAERRPMYVMDLPRLPENPGAAAIWTGMILGRWRGYADGVQSHRRCRRRGRGFRFVLGYEAVCRLHPGRNG
jgi:benzoyl-CoA reductase/2-hydroxyglutaryl-CoA dehydratase subunit BcrC/BadD/HgdB